MREFFETELKKLHLTCGLQQYSKLSDSEYTELLDLLCAKCEQFHLIPDEEKQKYIRQCMETDSEFLGFNAKILHKWLNVLNRGYIHTQAEHEELPRVELSPEESTRIDELLNTTKLSLMGQSPVYGDLEKEKKAIQKEDEKATVAPKAASTGYKVDQELAVQATLHNRYIKENYKENGERRACWTDYDTWFELTFPESVERKPLEGPTK